MGSALYTWPCESAVADWGLGRGSGLRSLYTWPCKSAVPDWGVGDWGWEHLVLLAALLLVLLVLGEEVVHVGLGLGELHLVHALAGVPVEEGLAAEHRGELLGDALHHLLHAGGVAAEAD